jgi:hypothetical protein
MMISPVRRPSAVWIFWYLAAAASAILSGVAADVVRTRKPVPSAKTVSPWMVTWRPAAPRRRAAWAAGPRVRAGGAVWDPGWAGAWPCRGDLGWLLALAGVRGDGCGAEPLPLLAPRPAAGAELVAVGSGAGAGAGGWLFGWVRVPDWFGVAKVIWAAWWSGPM